MGLTIEIDVESIADLIAATRNKGESMDPSELAEGIRSVGKDQLAILENRVAEILQVKHGIDQEGLNLSSDRIEQLRSEYDTTDGLNDYWDKVDDMADDAVDLTLDKLDDWDGDPDDALYETITDLSTNSVQLDEVSMVLEHTENPDAMLDGLFEGGAFDGPTNVEEVRRAAERFFRRDVQDQAKPKLQNEVNNDPSSDSPGATVSP